MSVVLGYDESPGAARALRVAIDVAAAFDERLVLVYGAAPPGPTGEEYRAHYEAIAQAGRAGLEHGVASAEAAGVSATVEVIDLSPAQALIEAASRYGARVIVVGSWGESPIRGALLGSTPHKLLHLSTVPVLCVPTEA
ncbi:universal stress protein [Streptomyces sp. NPDC053741]|uniref:UspA domain-containing protein n=3 Tax=Streptomyces TaxID=1883 RepID=A0A8D3WNW8_STRFA|nr:MULTISPECIES: universal stress protein [Streptomyces]MDF9873925.1 nucleotide-binding universal stress UspA family protein [Streptomyces pratensis]RAS32121.1 nucleotide-binding universal stress UspA family protein [Streptomyces avidinii]SNX75842.1 Nucleotide-binding universal stress protein, UspA family [Streptomyces microflavus]MCX4413895.1 universal stress protein [[Kitasatospora] papulosa]MCY1650128.1 universal stress protein [Streptomyces sp. SL203]